MMTEEEIQSDVKEEIKSDTGEETQSDTGIDSVDMFNSDNCVLQYMVKSDMNVGLEEPPHVSKSIFYFDIFRKIFKIKSFKN